MNAAMHTHLAYLGRTCPGYATRSHPADGLTADAGRILCRTCSDRLIAERKAVA